MCSQEPPVSSGPAGVSKGWVYILRSGRNGRYYIGHTTDIQRRLNSHASGKVKATRHLRPWTLAYLEQHANPAIARRREAYLKRLKSRKVLDALVLGWRDDVSSASR